MPWLVPALSWHSACRVGRRSARWSTPRNPPDPRAPLWHRQLLHGDRLRAIHGIVRRGEDVRIQEQDCGIIHRTAQHRCRLRWPRPSGSSVRGCIARARPRRCGGACRPSLLVWPAAMQATVAAVQTGVVRVRRPEFAATVLVHPALETGPASDLGHLAARDLELSRTRAHPHARGSGAGDVYSASDWPGERGSSAEATCRVR